MIYANGGLFVSTSRFKDYFATAQIASPKVQVGQPKRWESLLLANSQKNDEIA